MGSWLENLETENLHDVVCKFRGADGRYRWFNVRGEPLRASDGTVLRWYGVLIDIDEGKRAEDLLCRSEAHLAEAQRLSHSGASAYNETAILYGSEETYRIWGVDPAQGVPSFEALASIVDDADRAGDIIDRIRDHIKKSASAKVSFRSEQGDQRGDWIGAKRNHREWSSRSRLALRRGCFPLRGIVFNCNRSC